MSARIHHVPGGATFQTGYHVFQHLQMQQHGLLGCDAHVSIFARRSIWWPDCRIP